MKFISLYFGLLLVLEYAALRHAWSSEPQAPSLSSKKAQVSETEIDEDQSSACDDDYDNCLIAGAGRDSVRQTNDI